MASRVASSEAGSTALIYSALWGASADEEDKPRGGCAPERSTPGGGRPFAKNHRARRFVLFVEALKV